MEPNAIAKVIDRCLDGGLTPQEAARRLWQLQDAVPGLAMSLAHLSPKQRDRARALAAEFAQLRRREEKRHVERVRRQGKTGSGRDHDER